MEYDTLIFNCMLRDSTPRYVGLLVHWLVPFSVADTQLYKRLCLSIGLSISPSVSLLYTSVQSWWSSRKVWKRAFMMLQLWLSVWVWLSMGRGRVWIGLVWPCPPICNDVVTLRHLILFPRKWAFLAHCNCQNAWVIFFYQCPYPPACDWGSHVSGLVLCEVWLTWAG